jgi:hypothetical protein
MFAPLYPPRLLGTGELTKVNLADHHLYSHLENKPTKSTRVILPIAEIISVQNLALL